MSRRDRTRPRHGGSIRDRPRDPRSTSPSHRRGSADRTDDTARLERLTLALLPLRVFLGATFVYAGVDKLIDPAFLSATGPGSIGSQLEAFVKVSPIAPLIQIVGLTIPVETGLLIAIAEIAIGLGALSGLLFRLSAASGFALSVLFWLSASWATKPYYYGPDLPYAFGWLTLALAGTGGRFTVETWLAREFEGDPDEMPVSQERRFVLRAGLLGLSAFVVAGLAGTMGASVLGRSRSTAGTTTPGGLPTAGPTGIPTGTPTGTATAGPTATPTGDVAGAGASETVPPATAQSGPMVARVSQLASGRAVVFDDPLTGDPGVLLRLQDGSIVAFDTVCTHAGCTVEYDRGSGYLICPCHGAAFDPSADAAVIAGPTNRPLAPVPIHVDTASGRITLTG
jgi:thiosulfate dehydrogenase (quinone) large subunit